MTTPEDIDAFFDALVDGVGSHDEETEKRGDQQQQQTRNGPDNTGAQAAPAEAAAVTQHAAAVGDTSPRLSAASKAARAASAAEAAPTAAATGTAQQPVSRPPDRPQQPQQPSQQQQLQGAAFSREPPELRPEPPYRYDPYLSTEEGRQQQAADAQMETANLCASVFAVSRLIESKLKENEHMLFAVHENMTVGRYGEALCYFERLQQNLLFLAMLADQHRGGPTEGSTEAQQQAFYANRDFWSHEELQRLHHALRTPGQDLQQLAAAVGSKNSAQILSYLSHAADRHMMHRAAAGPAVGAAATGLVAQSASCTTAGGTTAATCATPGPVPAVGTLAANAAARTAQPAQEVRKQDGKHQQTLKQQQQQQNAQQQQQQMQQQLQQQQQQQIQQQQQQQIQQQQQQLQQHQQQQQIQQQQQQIQQQLQQQQHMQPQHMQHHSQQQVPQVMHIREQPRLQQFQQQQQPGTVTASVRALPMVQQGTLLGAPLLLQQATLSGQPLQQQQAAAAAVAQSESVVQGSGLARPLPVPQQDLLQQHLLQQQQLLQQLPMQPQQLSMQPQQLLQQPQQQQVPLQQLQPSQQLAGQQPAHFPFPQKRP